MYTYLSDYVLAVVRECVDVGPHKIRLEAFAEMMRERGCERSVSALVPCLADSFKRHTYLKRGKRTTRHFVIPVSEELFLMYPEPGAWPAQKEEAADYMPGVGTSGPVAGFILPPDGEANSFVQAYLDASERRTVGSARAWHRSLGHAEDLGQVSSNEARERREGTFELIGKTWMSKDRQKQLVSGS